MEQKSPSHSYIELGWLGVYHLKVPASDEVTRYCSTGSVYYLASSLVAAFEATAVESSLFSDPKLALPVDLIPDVDFAIHEEVYAIDTFQLSVYHAHVFEWNRFKLLQKHDHKILIDLDIPRIIAMFILTLRVYKSQKLPKLIQEPFIQETRVYQTLHIYWHLV